MVPGIDNASANMLALRRDLIAIRRLLDADRELLVGPIVRRVLVLTIKGFKRDNHSKKVLTLYAQLCEGKS